MIFESGKRPKSQEGLTLLEIVIAVAVLAILASLMLPLFGQGLRMADDSALTTSATYRTKKIIDEITPNPTTASTCRAVHTRTNELPASYTDGRKADAYTIRITYQQNCLELALTPSLVIGKLEARKGTAADGKILVVLYFSVAVDPEVV